MRWLSSITALAFSATLAVGQPDDAKRFVQFNRAEMVLTAKLYLTRPRMRPD